MTKQELIEEIVRFVSEEYDEDIFHEIDENFNLGTVLDSFNYVSLQYKLERLTGKKFGERSNKYTFKKTIRELVEMAQ